MKKFDWHFLAFVDPALTFLLEFVLAFFLFIIFFAAILIMIYGICSGIKFLWIHRKKIAKFDWDF